MNRSVLLAVLLMFALVSVACADSLTTPSATDAPLSSDSVNQQATTSGSSGLQYPLSPERQAMLRGYARFTNIWRFVDFFVSVVLFALLLFTGLSARFRDWAKVAKRRFLVTWLYLALIMVFLYVLQFPFDYYSGYVVESQYGFMNQSFGGWFAEGLKSLVVLLVIAIVPVWFFYFLVERAKRWWLVFAIGAIPCMIFFIVIAPVVITPMFNKFEPLKDKQLESQIVALAQKAGIEGSRVFEVDASKQSAKVNAYCTGLFGTTRIVLYDTLIKGFSYDEIRFVMGHEMGHYVMHHMWWGVLAAVIFMVIALWLADKLIPPIIARYRRRFRFDRLADIASLPLVMLFLTVFTFVFQPVSNALSRYDERQSDKFGMEITGVSGDVAATAFDKLSAYNLSDPDPSPLAEFWFYSHPALKKRMEFVRSYHPEK